MLRLTTPVDKNVCWRLPTKAITSWAAVGGDHELTTWIHDVLQTELILIRQKGVTFPTERIFTEKGKFSRRHLDWWQIVFSDNASQHKTFAVEKVLEIGVKTECWLGWSNVQAPQKDDGVHWGCGPDSLEAAGLGGCISQRTGLGRMRLTRLMMHFFQVNR